MTKIITVRNRSLLCVKIKHSRGGPAEWSVSVMPRWERNRSSEQVWIHRDRSWRRSWASQQPKRFCQQLGEHRYYWAVRALWVPETLWALSSAVTQWWIHSITSSKVTPVVSAVAQTQSRKEELEQVLGFNFYCQWKKYDKEKGWLVLCTHHKLVDKMWNIKKT